MDVVFGVLCQVDAVVGHVVRVCSSGGNGQLVGTGARSRAFGVDGVDVLAVGAGSFHHVFDVGAGGNFGTRGGALLFQLAVVDRVGVIGTRGNVGNLVAGGIDACFGHTWATGNGEAVCIQFAVACGHAVNGDVFGQFQLCTTGYSFADDVAVAFDIDGVAQCVVVAAGGTAEVDAFGDIGGVVGYVLVGRKQLAAVNGVFAVGIEVTIGYVGHFVACGIDTGLGQARTACNGHTVVVNGGIAGFDAVYYQVFVQLNSHFIVLGFGGDVVVAGNGHGGTQFFDIGAAAVAVEGQAFSVNGGFGIHTFLDVVFGVLRQVDAVVSCDGTIGCSCSIGSQIQSIGNLYRCFICADGISGFFA